MTGTTRGRTSVTPRANVKIYERARRVLPGGTSGEGKQADGTPVYFARAFGARLVDVDGVEYVDYHGGFGTALLGHSHPAVTEAVRRAMDDAGTLVGLPHTSEVNLCEQIVELVPSVEKVALCGGGGSDALYQCLRLARAVTGKSRVVKVEAGYHGWHDELGVGIRPSMGTTKGEAGGGSPRASSAGSLTATLDHVIVTTVNETAELEAVFARDRGGIAAVVLEPVLHSAGCIPVSEAYAARARELCDQAGALLIFDEIMTGFRHSLCGAEAYLGVRPDLSAFGKAISNGHVLALFGGPDALMSELSPTGPVFYSGTFNGQNLGVAAALATLEILRSSATLPRIHRMTSTLSQGITALIADHEVNASCQHFGGVWCLYFGARAVETEKDLAKCITPQGSRASQAFRVWMRDRGFYVHRRYVNRGFVMAAHTEADIGATLEAVDAFLSSNRHTLVELSTG